MNATTPLLVKSPAEWLALRASAPARAAAERGRLGFVPTMGALHEGHAALIRRSRVENDLTVASIYVNPTQFNDPKDLDRYPRTLERDFVLAAGAGASHVLKLEGMDLYPDGYAYKMSETSEDGRVLEGEHRPGHFTGMLTVVLKLLQLVQPTRAYFGEKDYQQLKLVQAMAAALFMPVEIVPCATVREKDGLAMSSRNARLSPEDRARAPLLAELLRSPAPVAEVRAKLESAGWKVDYVEERWGRRLAAAWLGGVRLIDNIALDQGGPP